MGISRAFQLPSGRQNVRQALRTASKVFHIAMATAAFILMPGALAAAEPRRQPDWAIDPAPVQLDDFRALMARQSRMAIALVSPKGNEWTLDREGTIAIGRVPSRLSAGDAEALGIDFSSRRISLLLPKFGPINKSRTGYMCVGMLSKPTRKQNGYSMCTTRLSKNIHKGYAAVTGIASLGMSSERVLNVDTGAISEIATALDFDAMEATIVADSREGGWAKAAPSRPPASLDILSTQPAQHIEVGVNAVGQRVCRAGLLEFTSCANAQFASSCVRGQKPGELHGFVEAYSPDQSSIRILISQPAFSDGQVPPLMAQYPTMNGLSSAPNSIVWDERKNWRICRWK